MINLFIGLEPILIKNKIDFESMVSTIPPKKVNQKKLFTSNID